MCRQKLYLPLLVSDEAVIGPVNKAVVTTFGHKNLSALSWVESTTHNWLHMDNMFHSIGRADKATEICSVYYSALNFKDVMMATGRLPVAGQ